MKMKETIDSEEADSHVGVKKLLRKYEKFRASIFYQQYNTKTLISDINVTPFRASTDTRVVTIVIYFHPF